MADTHETIADIIAAKRRLVAEMGKALGDQHSSVEMLKDDADRLEAAQKRERGDVAKLREALAPFPSLCEWLVENASKLGIPDMVAKLRERGDKARAALAATEKEGGAK